MAQIQSGYNDSVSVISEKIILKSGNNDVKTYGNISGQWAPTSIAFRFPDGTLNNGRFILGLSDASGNSRFVILKEDEHFRRSDMDQTQMCFLGTGTKVTGIKIEEGPDSISAELVQIHVPVFKTDFPLRVSSRTDCDSPSWIPQSIWRAGLSDPVKGRNATPTHHCIVHHSAGGNGDTNYTELVRNYYVFHTQVNGWDDIGYNYLIAANGLIYAGRDPEKAGIRQDDVQGAHFCSKNSYTMGVCMIGDFSLVQPADAAMNALTHLLGWKIKKDSLDPWASEPHPTLSDPLLAVIAGHRDGCSTECPGDSLYARLNWIRSEAAECAVVNSVITHEQSKPLFKTLESGWKLENIQVGTKVVLYDIRGRRLVEAETAPADGVFLPCTDQGVFVIRVIGTDGRIFSFRVCH